MSTASVRAAWNGVLKELQPPFSPSHLRLCEALSTLFAECSNTIRMNGGDPRGLFGNINLVPVASGSDSPSLPSSAISPVPSALQSNEEAPKAAPPSVSGGPLRTKAKAHRLKSDNTPNGKSPSSSQSCIRRATPYRRHVLTRFSSSIPASIHYPRPQPRLPLSVLMDRLRKRINKEGRVKKMSSGNMSCLIKTNFDDEVLVDPRDDTKAYVAFDFKQELQLCFPEPPSQVSHGIENGITKKPYPLDNDPSYNGVGKSASNNYLWYRRGFETSEAVKICLPSESKMLQDFETKYKGKDPQYINIRHLSNDIAWIPVENIIAAIPKKLWTADNTFDPTAVYEGLLFDSLL